MDENKEAVVTPEEMEQLRIEAAKENASGEVKVKKRSFWSKVKQAILPDNETSMKNFLINRVLLPSIKNMFWSGVDQIRYRSTGQTSGKVYLSDRGEPYTPYGSKAKNSRVVESENYLWDYDTLYFSDPGFANRVLEEMKQDVLQYGKTSVAAMYEYAGKSTNGSYTYRNYGWTNLSGAGVRRLGSDYILELPKARPLQ